jgi:hypothetical protein
MNLKTTLALLVLVAVGGALVWLKPQLPGWLDPAPKAAPAADAGTRAEMASLRADRLRHIEVRRGDRVTVLDRTPDGWNMPGNWPTRTAEAQALAEAIAGLRSRFEPEPITSDADLAKKGLNPPALTLSVSTDAKTNYLALGEEMVGADQFARATYLRLDQRPEVVRLASGLIAQFDRPPDYYQQRRLFPGERVVKDADSAEKVERLAARSVTVEEKKNAAAPITLVRGKDDTWELEQPVRDRLDSRARDALLAAVPDVWAENFVTTDPAAVGALAAAGMDPQPFLAAAVARFWTTTKGLEAKSGLYAPERVLTVSRADGIPVTLLIGRPSGSRARKVLRPPPPGMPPNMPAREREETVFDEYRYAKLKDNDQVFEIKADKLKDVFVALDTLREPQVASFNNADARGVEITQGSQKIVLAKDKERWRLTEPVQADADSAKVTDLLSKLSGLQARDKDVIDKEDPKKYEINKDSPQVKVTLEEETKERDSKGDKIKKTRTLVVRLGKHDTAAKKLYVMVDDWPRINAVDESLDALVRRPAVAFRGKRVFDFFASDLAKLEVQRGNEKYTLERTKDGWRLLSPAATDADGLKVDQLASNLSALEVLEYADEAPRAEDLGPKYGLDKPALSVRLEFSDKTKPARILQVGKGRGSKPGTFARLAEAPEKVTPVFVLPKDVHDSLDRDSLAYLPAQLWQLLSEDITAVRVHREKEDEYRLSRDGSGWKITGPFEATAQAATAGAMVNDLASPQAQSYKAHQAKDLAAYGLDKPHLSVTVSAKNGKEHTLLIGAPAGKDSPGRFAKLTSGSAVFVVADAVPRAADRAALELLEPVLLHLEENQVERVQGKGGDNAMTLEHKDEKWRVSEGPGAPFPADTDAVTSLAGLLAGLRAERFAAYGKDANWKKYGLDKPNATLTVRVKPQAGGPAEHTVELGGAIEGNGKARYARVDKGPGVAVLDAATAEVLTRTHLDYVNRHVLQFDTAQAQSLLRQQGDDVLEVVKKDDGWRLIKPADERADDKAVQDLLGQLGDLRARRIAAYPAKNLAPFGLDKPVVVTIKLAGSKPAEHVVKVGKPVSAASTDRFAQVDSGPAVAVLPAGLADRLTAGPIAFRDRNLARFADADTATLERGPRKATFRRVDGTWKLTEPLEGEAEHDEMDDFVNTLARLRADALVAEKPNPADLSKYGLEKPEARWRLAAGDKEVLNIALGNAEDHMQRRYARLAGRDLVFLLDPKLSAKALGEFRPRTVWNPSLDASQVESLRFGWARNPFVLEKGDGSTWQVAGKSQIKVNTETVNEVLAALAKLKLARYVLDKGADPRLFGLDKPELVLEVLTRNGKRTLEVGNFAEGTKSRYARIPGPERSDVFLVDEADCARIFLDTVGFTRPPTSSTPAVPSTPVGAK